jgi:resolvase-like protein/recombinase-like zinc beta ribbon protein/recombinase
VIYYKYIKGVQMTDSKDKNKEIDNDTLVMCYMRWSTKDQFDGDSGRRQLTEAEKWCEENGYKFDKKNVIQDSGKSGYYAENFSKKGALGKFIFAVKNKQYDKGTILLIEDYSRFSRDNVLDALGEFTTLLKGEIELVFVRDNLRYTYESIKKDSNKLFATICYMNAAHEESARKSYHLKKFWNGVRGDAVDKSIEISEKFEKTQELPTQYPVLFPSNAPNWLKKVELNGKKYYEEIPERTEIIKYIFQLAEFGIDSRGLGNSAITNRLNNEDIKRFTKKKKKINVTKVNDQKYKNITKSLEEKEKEKEKEKEDLGLGTSAIASVLNLAKVEPFKGEKQNTSKNFNDSYVFRLLNDRRLLGEFQPHINPYDKNLERRLHKPDGKPIEHYFPQIITPTTFKNVRDKIEGRKRYHGGQSSKIFTNLFTKIAKCACCGNSMAIATKKGSKAEGGRSTYLQCRDGSSNDGKYKVNKCGNKSVRYFDTLEKSIIHSLVELDLSQLFDISVSKDELELSTLKNQAQSIEKKISLVETDIINATRENVQSNFKNKYLKIVIEEDIVKQQKLEMELENLNQEIANTTLSDNSSTFFGNLKTVIDTFDKKDSDKTDQENRDITCNKRRAINMQLADLVQYIAIDGSATSGAKYAWVVFDLNIIKAKILRAIENGNEWILTNTNNGNLKKLAHTTSNEEFAAMGIFPAHIKIKLNRFKNCDPTQDELFIMRESFQVAPKELIKVNEKINDAINRGWKHLRRKEYKVLDNDAYNTIFEEALPSMDDDLIAELEQKYNDNINSEEQLDFDDEITRKAKELYGTKE